MGIFIILSSVDYVRKHLSSPGELLRDSPVLRPGYEHNGYVPGVADAYIALELMSFCFYIMASYARENARSNEAGIKYILIGAFSTAILLFGISMIYSTIQVTRFEDISAVLANLETLARRCGWAWPWSWWEWGSRLRRCPSTCGPRRLRRSAPACHGLPGHRLQGRRLCPGAADVFRGVSAGGGRLADSRGSAGGCNHDGGATW